MSECGPFQSINSGWICRVVWKCASVCVPHAYCACHVDLEFADMPAPLETCWHTSRRYMCSHTYTRRSPLPPQPQFPRPLASKGSPVSDAGDSGESERGRAEAGFGFLTCGAGPPVRPYWSTEGSQAPFFLSFSGSGGHSSPRPWLGSSNSHLCQKNGPCRATPNWPLSSGGMKPWRNSSWRDLFLLLTRVIHSSLVNAQSCLYKAKPPLTALLDCHVLLSPNMFLSISRD